MDTTNEPISFTTLGMFIIDEFAFADEHGRPTERTLDSQIGGGGTYTAVGARIWLPPSEVGMIVDKGHDFPERIAQSLAKYGRDMWFFREQSEGKTTRALNSYLGKHRNFEYLTPRIRITPNDLKGTRLDKAKVLHFICSPTRALHIMSEVDESWTPITIYEPVPDRCVPEELPSLQKVLPSISILSPNAEEALSLLSMHVPPSKDTVEEAAHKFLEFGIGRDKLGWVIIRSGELGAYVTSHKFPGKWVDAYWRPDEAHEVVDVTGAGNSFLGGLAAGLLKSNGDVYSATLYATVSASFIIEQEGLPVVSGGSAEVWNGDDPFRRLELLKRRHET